MMQLKQSKKNRIEKVYKHLDEKFFIQMQIINALEKEVKEGQRKRKEEINRKLNPYDQFLRSYGIEKVQNYEVYRSNNIDRKTAADLFGRKEKFRFVDELIEIRAMRRENN